MKRLIIILVPIAVIVLIVAAYFLFQGKSQPVPAPSAGDASSSDTVTGPVVSPPSSLPADVPQGDTITLQGKNGSAVVNNFYKNAQGYWAAMNALAIQQNKSYTIWYYRSDATFSIDLSATATADDQRAAEAQLMSELGVTTSTFCNLSVSVTFPVDQGAEREYTSLITSCPSNSGFQ